MKIIESRAADWWWWI